MSSGDSFYDPSKPDWWNEARRKQRRNADADRHSRIREDNERRKMAAGNVATYSSRGITGTGVRVGAQAERDDGRYSRKQLSGMEAGVGAYYDDSKEAMDERKKKLEKFNNMDVMDMQDDRLKTKANLDEELEGKSIWDLIDRGTLMVGCCLIVVVIIAVTIPVTLISEDQPYIAPKIPDPPSPSPTVSRQQDYWPIFDNLQRIAGGADVLGDPNTAQNRALNWIVYEDGMELGAEKDHLHQRFVLMVIYYISGPWTPVQGRLEWGSPVHECEWEGITCKPVEDLEQELNGRIEELLEVGREDGIKIDVPRRIINKLELRQRLVSGEVPEEFSLLYYLQHLDLENNKLIGAIPTPLYKLFNLQTLFLEQNGLTNIDSLGEYRHLEYLSLSKNAFQGPLPESFRNLKKLKTLYLHTNRFNGEIFDILKDFTLLEKLDIAFNEFSGTLPAALGDMKNLTSFFGGHNKFNGEIPAELVNCRNLKQFQIDGSPDIGGEIPDFIGQLTKLEFIKIDTCAFKGRLPRSIGNLAELTFLDVNSNELSGAIPTTLGKLTKLKTLALANNDFEGTVPSELGKLTNLEKLYLQNTDLSGIMPEEVCGLRGESDGTLPVLEVNFVGCDVECDRVRGTGCCTNQC